MVMNVLLFLKLRYNVSTTKSKCTGQWFLI